jgi:serine/threonine-protein kinase HipA
LEFVWSPETDISATAGPISLERIKGLTAPRPAGLVKFSLAGVQLKFAALSRQERLTVPAATGQSRCIIKVASDHYPGLPEAEFAAMSLCNLVGINTAQSRLIPTGLIDGIPDALLRHGPVALVVDRFDRDGAGGRIHIEDCAQIVGAIGERKYTMATTETILNMIKRFSTDPRADLIEAIHRIVGDILIGNGDSHLKNWSFIFPVPGEIRLAPAYDIVPTVLFAPCDTLALSFVGTNAFESVTLRKFRRVAAFLKLDPDWIEREVRLVITRAVSHWPVTAASLLSPARSDALLARLENLPLVREVQS